MRLGWLVALLSLAGSAHAHVGPSVSNAAFTSPPSPSVTPADAGLLLAPFTFPTADQSYPISWEDGDVDPTGRFFFYFLDHQPSYAVGAGDVENLATPALAVGGDGKTGVNMWASCTCDADAGVVCPDLGGSRPCDNSFVWDTRGIANGTYWILAVNNDPPFHVYSSGNSPIRIAHNGAAPTPAAIVLRPDGYGSFDTSYRVQWAATGKAPLKFDLAYGIDDDVKVLGPTTLIGTNVQVINNPDGTFSYDWDISKLPQTPPYFLRVTVTDADGQTSYTDSHFGLSVYHPDTDGGPVDLARSHDGNLILTPPPSSCSCELGGAASTGLVMTPLALLFFALLAMRASRRRR